MLCYLVFPFVWSLPPCLILFSFFFVFFFDAFIILLCILAATVLSSSIVGIQCHNQNTTYGIHNGIALSERSRMETIRPVRASTGLCCLQRFSWKMTPILSRTKILCERSKMFYTLAWHGVYCVYTRRAFSSIGECTMWSYEMCWSGKRNEQRGVPFLSISILFIHVCGTVDSSVFYGWFKLDMGMFFSHRISSFSTWMEGGEQKLSAAVLADGSKCHGGGFDQGK